MKRIVVSIILLLSIFMLLTSCNKKKETNEPDISIKLNVSDLTDDEYKSVGTKNIDNATKDDFKSIDFSLYVKNSSKTTDRKIEVPDLKRLVKSYDEKRYWFGSESSQDNSSENFAQYSKKIVFYSKGLINEDIKKIFLTSEVNVLWTINNTENEKVYNLGSILTFEKN